MFQDLNILIIESNLTSRTRLREVLKLIVISGRNYIHKNIRETLQRLPETGAIHIVFISSDCVIDDIKLLFSALEEKYKGSMPVVVSLYGASQREATYINERIQAGVKGFIGEPFSVDSLIGPMQQAQALQGKDFNEDTKQMASYELILKEATHYIDILAKRVGDGLSMGGLGLKQIKRLKPMIKEGHDQNPDVFHNVMIKVFSAAEAAKNSLSKRKIPAAKQVEILHPGAMVARIMTERKIDKEKLRSMLKIEEADLDSLLSQKLAVSESLARDLARVLGKTQKFWIELQSNFDKMQEKNKEAGTHAS